ncbi:MAG: hypothetical protein IKD89_00410 [Clostridia bacterium]|nr:hypothetical protein [Clostridia bacterium]
MKKLLISLLIFAMIIVSCACGTQDSESTDTSGAETEASSETADTAETDVPDVPDKSPESGDYSALVGTWYDETTYCVLTVYENGGFALDDNNGHYDGYLVYTDEKGGKWSPVPRYEMYLENNEPLYGDASLSFDDNHPGCLVYAISAGAQLLTYDGSGEAAETDSDVFVQYDEYATVCYQNEYTYTLPTESETVKLVFYTDKSVKNLTLLSLTFVDFDDEGSITFSVEPLYTVDEFGPADGLLFDTVFYGSIPNNGFSYVNENGETKYYTIEQSGKDGSICLIEFIPAE